MKTNGLKQISAILILAAATTQAAEPTGTNSGGARITFAEPSFNFGRVESGRVVSHDFIFTNTGDRVLEISDIRSSCGCTATTNWDRRIEPGKTGKIPVLFNSGGMSGPVRKNLWLTSNDPIHPDQVIEFTALIWKPIDALPAVATFIFGPDFQTNETRVIRLVSNLPEPVRLDPPVCTNAAFKVALATVTEGKEYELRVTVVPPLGPGSLNVPITMTTSSAKMPVVTVAAYAMVQPALIVTPPRIVLPPTPLTEAGKYVVTIRNNAAKPATLSEPAINATGASVQLRELQPGKLFELTVNFPVGFGSQTDEPIVAQLKSDQPQSPLIRVPVMQLEPSSAN